MLGYCIWWNRIQLFECISNERYQIFDWLIENWRVSSFHSHFNSFSVLHHSLLSSLCLFIFSRLSALQFSCFFPPFLRSTPIPIKCFSLSLAFDFNWMEHNAMAKMVFLWIYPTDSSGLTQTQSSKEAHFHRKFSVLVRNWSYCAQDSFDAFDQ